MSDQLLRHAGYTGSMEVSAEDDCLHGRILHISDLITYEGGTVAELRAEFEAAVRRYLDHCASIGKTPNRPYTGSFNVRLGQDRHRWLVEASASQGRTLNELVGDAVDMLRAQAPRDSVSYFNEAFATAHREMTRSPVLAVIEVPLHLERRTYTVRANWQREAGDGRKDLPTFVTASTGDVIQTDPASSRSTSAH